MRRVAIALALVTTGVFCWIRRIDNGTTQVRVRTASVVIAERDMPEGAAIDRMAVAVAQWPLGTVPAGAYTSIDSVDGRVTRVAIYKGEALIPGRLASQGTPPGLGIRITPGKRAFS